MVTPNESDKELGPEDGKNVYRNSDRSDAGSVADNTEQLRVEEANRREAERALTVDQTIVQSGKLGAIVDFSETDRLVTTENMGSFREDAEYRRRMSPALAAKFNGTVRLAEIMSRPKKRGPL